MLFRMRIRVFPICWVKFFSLRQVHELSFRYKYPYDFVFGLASLVVITMSIIFGFQKYQNLSRLKKDRPLIMIGIFLSATILFSWLIGHILMFTLAVLVPIVGMLIHATFRMRNMSNKLANRVERMGLATTPMGTFLGSIGATEKMFNL
ncbi:hypothetical protein ACOME3_010106 [Neoechinorhynchus agilis]